MTSPAPPPEVYKTGSKLALVTRDPVHRFPGVVDGKYIGRKPHNYLPLAIISTFINPLFGPIAIYFAVMSDRAYLNGDIRYALKWGQYAFMMGIVSIIVAIVVGIAIGFTLSPLGLKGGHTP